jgi:hypothetical protein
MPTLPPTIIAILSIFAPLFSYPGFTHGQVLVVGASLTPGRRTVTNILRTMGVQPHRHCQNYQRVLNRARWSSCKAAQTLLTLLVQCFAPHGVLVMGIDATVERRQGDTIAANGMYRDAARSSKQCFVKASGRRWISLMLLAPMPWAGRVWALPLLTVRAPSERYAVERGKRHTKLTDWARHRVLQVRRWLPERAIVLVADRGYAVLVRLDRCARRAHPGTVVTRLRLAAALDEPAPQRLPQQNGRPRLTGKRVPTFQHVLDASTTPWTRVTVARWYSQGPRDIDIVSATCVWYHSGMPVVPIRWVLIRDPQGNVAPQALLGTDIHADPMQGISWFVLRGHLATTFHAVRPH